MALSLNAEQKSISSIFVNEQVFVIPQYQRPYSWGYDQCYQLYNDIIEAFESDQDYFIGNIIWAKSKKPKNELQVVDGQQRLITLWIIMKVLNVLCPDINTIKDSLFVKAREGDKVIMKIRSESLENNDNDDIETFYNINESSFGVIGDFSLKTNCQASTIEANGIDFYKWFSYYKKNKGDSAFKELIYYFLDNVYLLPIELYDDNASEAQEKALKIFETINNRGMNLEDADIFKAKLYNRASTAKEKDDFVLQWKGLKEQCATSGVLIDDLFRFYSHIVRGQNNINSMEKNMRDFFTQERFSPILSKPYNAVLDDLTSILNAIQFIDKESKSKTSQIGKWFQLIQAYPNYYPKIALIVYLFTYGLDDILGIESFSKKIIRYSYSQGATRSVKFEIYNIIVDVCNKRCVKDYYITYSKDSFEHLGRLRDQFALLAYYLNGNGILPFSTTDRICNNRDWYELDSEWAKEKKERMYDSIGNIIVLDIPKKNSSFQTRCAYYGKSELDEVKQIFTPSYIYSPSVFEERNNRIIELLKTFFVN